MADEQDVLIPEGPYPLRRPRPPDQSRRLHLVEEIPEFQPGRRARVREEGGRGPSPDKKWLGQEGTVQQGTGRPTEAGPPTFYFVEFHSSPLVDKVFAISSGWLEDESFEST